MKTRLPSIDSEYLSDVIVWALAGGSAAAGPAPTARTTAAIAARAMLRDQPGRRRPATMVMLVPSLSARAK